MAKFRISTCPFCNKTHKTLFWSNVICTCGAKFYTNTNEWLDRMTGIKIKVNEVDW